jgi:hypothetical protein
VPILPQDLIHKFELATSHRYFRFGLLLLVLLGGTVIYDSSSFRNLTTQEAMDSAQLARNIARGRGYSTQFIRPFSASLVRKRSLDKYGAPAPGKLADLARVRTPHPDLANAPIYPLTLAALIKVLPFHYEVDTSHPFWSVPKTRFSDRDKTSRQFWRYQPDFLIGLFNQLLFFGLTIVVFLLAERLFDRPVAWMSVALLLGNELLWRFSVSGLSTMLLLLIFMGLVGCLLLLDRELREPKWRPGVLPLLAAVAGVLVGLGALTRYSFGWLIIPVLGFLILFSGPRRVPLVLIALATFALVMLPWVARNYSVSGTPFGTAGYAIFEAGGGFSENQLARSLDPRVKVSLPTLAMKLFANLRQILQSDLPRLGGSWITAFFLVGLLVPFRNAALSRLRYFLLMSLATLTVAQALGRTQLAEDSPDVNSENLLVLLLPLLLVYGVSLFWLLLDQIPFAIIQFRYGVIGAFSVIMCLPLLLSFLPPRAIPVAYPPYYPPAIQGLAGWLKDDELTMSDIPWAMAWYGDRQCIWLTMNAQGDFFAVNDFMKPVSLLYLTPATMDSRFLSQWIRSGEQSWGSFVLESTLRKEVPPSFPLRKSQAGWLPEQLVLTDWERWRKNP